MPVKPALEIKQNWGQQDDWSCGGYAMAVALDALGWSVEEAQRLVSELICSPIDGTDPRTIESFLRNNGCKVQSGEMDIPDLAHHTCTMRRPVMCLVQYKTRLGQVGHWVTVLRATRKMVTYYCPAKAKAVKVKASVFRETWVDYDRFGTQYVQFGLVPFV